MSLSFFPFPRMPLLGQVCVLALGLAAAGAGLSACAPLGIAVGAGAAGGAMALEERGFTASARDKVTGTTIEKKLIDHSFELFRNVGVTVIEDRVYLTGVVATQDQRIEAAKIAWGTERVRDVVNEIEIGERGDLIDSGRDQAIETKLSSILTFDGQVSAVNYSIEAVNGTVYIFGIAQSQAEIDRVQSQARGVANVRRIVSHAVLKNDPGRQEWLKKQESGS